ncbi:hypothetical protein DUI87_28376 [Hirundo rustica rustica]|uniref:Uncharacterized protein n=1 Tax=Hirundo rustica rustica TaxID=333673 RepID=A0A3M0J392_HIRRU|nr:hypothetical protein DUI87_28376 [Hirundo rustica rustica]
MTFTVAILFSNPLDHNLFPMELSLELIQLKAHLGRLEDTFTRMSQRGTAPTINRTTVCHHVTLTPAKSLSREDLEKVPKVFETILETLTEGIYRFC